MRCLAVHHPPDSRGEQDGGTKTQKTFYQAIDTPVIFIWMPVSLKVISSERFVLSRTKLVIHRDPDGQMVGFVCNHSRNVNILNRLIIQE